MVTLWPGGDPGALGPETYARVFELLWRLKATCCGRDRLHRLWGLASFDTQRRVKEISIRKTLGASSSNIVRLLMRPVLLANLLARPLAFLAMRTWLERVDGRIALIAQAAPLRATGSLDETSFR